MGQPLYCILKYVNYLIKFKDENFRTKQFVLPLHQKENLLYEYEANNAQFMQDCFKFSMQGKLP